MKLILILWSSWKYPYYLMQTAIAQSAGAVEYTDCISAERYPSPTPEYPGHGTKSHGEALVMLKL